MDVVAARDLAERFVAGGDALPGLVLLVRGELGLAAELDSGGDGAGIAVFHATIMQQIYAAKKRNRFNELILLRFS